MKNLKLFSALFLMFVLVSSCGKDKDSCEQWYEGDSCEAMVNKFIGNYTGGAGFCGTNYEYIVTATPNVVNGITIQINNPGTTGGPQITALLKTSTTFEIPLQQAEQITGDGNLVGDQLTFFFESQSLGASCTHVATKI